MRSSLGRLADHGRPIPRETWDQQYRDGTWEWLGSIDEFAHYAIHPVSTLVRYARALERNGAIIVSLVRHQNHGRIWKNAARHFRTADSTTVINAQGVIWDIRVLRPMRKALSA